MKRSEWKLWVLIATGLLVLVAASPRAFGAAGGGSVRLVDYETSGATVVVHVVNTDAEPRTGKVVVEAVVGRQLVTGFASYAVLGGQEASVAVAFPTPPSEVRGVSITDDPTPF